MYEVVRAAALRNGNVYVCQESEAGLMAGSDGVRVGGSMMGDSGVASSARRSDLVFIGGFALFALVLHLVYNRWYGYHHDEFYFLACGYHLAFGYVDHPPLTPWIARLSDELFGQSLTGLRFFPAVASAVAVFLTGLLARRLGGGRFAQSLACVAYIIAPVYLRSQNVLAIPSFEPVFWVACSYLVVRIIQDDNPKLWLCVGAIAGIGLMNKHTMAFFGVGLVVGLLLTRHRKHFLSPWLYAGGAVASLIFLPNLVWQMQNDWPTVQFIRRLNAEVMSGISLPQFVLGQLLYLHPFNAAIWLAGLVWLFRGEAGKPYRILGWIWVTVFLLLLVAKSKIYYLAPAYPAVLAAGGVALGAYAERKGRAWFRPAAIGTLTVGGIVFAPVALPILPIETTDRYIRTLSFGALDNVYEITGDLHGQFGWQTRIKRVAEIYESLPENERDNAVIFAPNYGLAGMVDYLGKDYGLPNAISGHMTYYLWGPGDGPFDTAIALDMRREDLEQVFEQVDMKPPVVLEHTNPGNREFYVAVCRKPKLPIDEIWPELRAW